MLVALILPHEIESVLVEIEAHKRLHSQYEVCQVKCMLDLLAIQPFYFKVFIIKLDILVYAIVHNLHLVKSDKLSLSLS